MTSFDDSSSNEKNEGVSWDDLSQVMNGDFGQEEEEDVFFGGSAKLSPSLLNADDDFLTGSSIASNLMIKAKEHIAQKAVSATATTMDSAWIDIPMPNTTTTTENIKKEIPLPASQSNGGDTGMKIDPVLEEEKSSNTMENGKVEIDQSGVITTSSSDSSSSSSDDDDGMEIDQGSSTVVAAAATTSLKQHSEFLYSSSDDDEEPTTTANGDDDIPRKEESTTTTTNGGGSDNDGNASYSEEDGSSSSAEEEDEFANLSDDEYDEKLWKQATKKGSFKKELQNLTTGPKNDNCELMASPQSQVRPAKRAAKKVMKKHVAKLRLMKRIGGIKDEDLDDEVVVRTVRETLGKENADGVRKTKIIYGKYTGIDETNLGDAPTRGFDGDYQNGAGDEPHGLSSQKALEQKKKQIMQKFAKELDESINVILERCDKDKARAVLTAFREVGLELRQDLPLDYVLPLCAPATAKEFLYVNPAEFMQFKACLGDMLYERLKKMPVQKATSRNVARPDHELLACFKELKLTSPGDFIKSERDLTVRSILHRCCKVTPLAGTNGEYHSIVMRHPFYKFWEEIGNAVEIQIRKIKIRENFDAGSCRCAMTGQELIPGQPCFSLTYTCRVKGDGEDDDVEKFETRAMFLCRPTNDPSGDYPRMDTIVYASFELLNIIEYAKQRWIEWWIKKYAYVPKTQGIEKCMQEFISGKNGLMALKKWYYEYKLMGTLLDRFVAL